MLFVSWVERCKNNPGITDHGTNKTKGFTRDQCTETRGETPVDFDFTEVLNELHDGIAVFDSQDRLLYVNDSCREIFEAIADAFVVGHSFGDLMAAAGDRNLLSDAFVGSGEIELSDGRVLMLRENRMPSGGVVRTFTDLTEFRLAEEQIVYLASHDEVTGLPNRSLFLDRISVAAAHAKRTGSRFAVLFLDLDGFKEVNDRLGHEAGDMVLHQVAVRLVARVRASDTVARFGGDEFTIILNHVSGPEDARQVAAEILGELTRPFTVRRETALIGVSIGIAIYPDDGEEGENLIRLADEAMYAVKYAGKRGIRLVGEGQAGAGEGAMDGRKAGVVC